MYRGLFILSLLVVAALMIFIWASDRITMEGERTVYTVSCEQGAWEGLRCTGRMAAGDRHRFRASRSRHEIVYWIAGSSKPSGKYTECDVTDRDRWTCKAREGDPPSITHAMEDGRPVQPPGVSNAPFRAVTKWKWWAIYAGIPGFRKADFSSTVDPRHASSLPAAVPPAAPATVPSAVPSPAAAGK
jgi:hypothetical protein